jgi:hypothetical protein
LRIAIGLVLVGSGRAVTVGTASAGHALSEIHASRPHAPHEAARRAHQSTGIQPDSSRRREGGGLAPTVILGAFGTRVGGMMARLALTGLEFAQMLDG